MKGLTKNKKNQEKIFWSYHFKLSRLKHHNTLSYFIKYLSLIKTLPEIVLSDLNEDLERLIKLVSVEKINSQQQEKVDYLITFYLNILVINLREQITQKILLMLAHSEDLVLKEQLSMLLSNHLDGLRELPSTYVCRLIEFLSEVNLNLLLVKKEDLLKYIKTVMERSATISQVSDRNPVEKKSEQKYFEKISSPLIDTVSKTEDTKQSIQAHELMISKNTSNLETKQEIKNTEKSLTVKYTSYSKRDQALLFVARNLDFFASPFAENTDFQRWAQLEKNSQMLKVPSSNLKEALKISKFGKVKPRILRQIQPRKFQDITHEIEQKLATNEKGLIKENFVWIFLQEEGQLVEIAVSRLPVILRIITDEWAPLGFFSRALIGSYVDLDNETRKKLTTNGNCLKNGDPENLKLLLLVNSKLVEAILSFREGAPNIVDRWYHDHKSIQRGLNEKDFFQILKNCRIGTRDGCNLLNVIKDKISKIDKTKGKIDKIKVQREFLYKTYLKIVSSPPGTPEGDKKLLNYMDSILSNEVVSGYFGDSLGYFFPVLYRIQQSLPLSTNHAEVNPLLSEISVKIAELERRRQGATSTARTALSGKLFALKNSYVRMYYLAQRPNMDGLEKLIDCLENFQNAREIKTYFCGSFMSPIKFSETGTEKLLNEIEIYVCNYRYNLQTKDKTSLRPKVFPKGYDLLVRIQAKITELNSRIESRLLLEDSRQILRKKRVCLQKTYSKIYSFLHAGNMENLIKLSKYTNSLKDNVAVKASIFNSSSFSIFNRKNKTGTEILLDAVNDFIQSSDANLRLAVI